MRERIAANFGFEFTQQQQEAVHKLEEFLLAASPTRTAFILRGYAGTGKTSLIAALVKTLLQTGCPTILLAPTGRAAKVFSRYANQTAYTIHKMIYRQRSGADEDAAFSLAINKHRNTLFIVDEASMIASRRDPNVTLGAGSLLDNLITYVYSGAGCRLLLVGDTAQLPPVGEYRSLALSAEQLTKYDLRVQEHDLTQVVRQAAESGVLWNATALRQQISIEDTDELPRIKLQGFNDIGVLPGRELLEALENSYGRIGYDDTIIITRSNKRANLCNNAIRAQILNREEELEVGDLVMIVKNNYYWVEQLTKSSSDDEPLPVSFLANGDVAVVKRMRNVCELYGFRFADVTLRFPDYDDFELDCKVLLDALQSESPSLTAAQNAQLYQQVAADYLDVPSQKERSKKLHDDPYLGALQIKFAYAVTCHKAQGGQWKHVYVDQGYMPPEGPEVDYLRWLYTAFTRTTEHLYLLNWDDEQIQPPSPI